MLLIGSWELSISADVVSPISLKSIITPGPSSRRLLISGYFVTVFDLPGLVPASRDLNIINRVNHTANAQVAIQLEQNRAPCCLLLSAK
jgi:hypothetical protein